jgi:hypothetical protein
MVALPPKVSDWPEEWKCAFEERAGIMEYLGKFRRKDAERQAEERVRLEYARTEEQ